MRTAYRRRFVSFKSNSLPTIPPLPLARSRNQTTRLPGTDTSETRCTTRTSDLVASRDTVGVAALTWGGYRVSSPNNSPLTPAGVLNDELGCIVVGLADLPLHGRGGFDRIVSGVVLPRSSGMFIYVRLVLFLRTVIVPLFVIPVVLFFARLGESVSTIALDPVFAFAMIILGCGPTAINLVQICQAKAAFEDEMGRVLFWSYAVVAVPLMTTVVLIALWAVVHIQ